ncbi:MAG: hypothetical protein ACLGJA_24290, partial [Gammaproteobacteria bacterium]
MGLSCVIVVLCRPQFSVVQRCSLSMPGLFSCSAKLFIGVQSPCNCAAISHTYADAELFGYSAGTHGGTA